MTETATTVQPLTTPIVEQPAALATPSLPAVQDRRPRKPANPRPPGYSVEVAKAILAVAKAVGEVQKEGKNEFQHYKYVRWEDINEKLSPLLQKHDLILIQNEVSRSLLEETPQGSVLAIVYNFTWLHAASGEQWPPIEWTGIARLRDQKGITDDKAATKCSTQAEKYFCVKQFKIIITDEGMIDADKAASLPKKDAREAYARMQDEIRNHTTVVGLQSWGRANNDRKRVLPPDWQEILTALYNDQMDEIKNTQREAGDEVTWDDVHDPKTGEVSD
jgi:hypothetical protein